MTPQLTAIISEISSIADVKILSGPLKGGSNTVYEIKSEHGRWCLRIPHDDGAASFARKGTTVLKDAKERRPELLAPAVVYQSDNYIVMEYLDGEALKSWNTQVLPKERRQVLLDDLATFLFSLWTIEEVRETQGTSRFCSRSTP
jgi:aminoglycoside phosphotransferase (APT) family kinase protein